MADATPNLTTAIISGWATVSPILVAVDAEAQSMANKKPAASQANFVLLFIEKKSEKFLFTLICSVHAKVQNSFDPTEDSIRD